MARDAGGVVSDDSQTAQSYHLPSMTGIATAIYEDEGRHRRSRMLAISRTSIVSSPALKRCRARIRSPWREASRATG